MRTVKDSKTDVSIVLNQVKDLLERSMAKKALDILGACGKDAAAIRNATGVCLLRLGQTEAAVRVFRELVFPGGAFAIPRETPAVFRANYAASLLIQDNLSVGIDLLEEIADRENAEVAALLASVQTWKHSLPWWRRLLLVLGFYPRKSFHMSSVPGILWFPEAQDTGRPMRNAA